MVKILQVQDKPINKSGHLWLDCPRSLRCSHQAHEAVRRYLSTQTGLIATLLHPVTLYSIMPNPHI